MTVSNLVNKIPERCSGSSRNGIEFMPPKLGDEILYLHNGIFAHRKSFVKHNLYATVKRGAQKALDKRFALCKNSSIAILLGATWESRMATKKTASAPESTSIVAYKGFDKDWKCRGYQFEVGKTYTHKGAISLCKSGFHAVEFPLDAFSYYSPTSSAYASVTLGGVTEEKREDSKRVGSKITVDAKMSLVEFIKAHVKIVVEKADKNIGTGDSGHAAATGDSGHAAATGYSGHAAATGYSGHAAATGNSGHAAATGNCGAAFAGFSGQAKAGASGSFAIVWFDEESKRARIAVGTPGEDNIKADTFYSVKNGKLVEA